MLLKKLLRSFLSGVRQVNKKAMHAGKGKGHAKAKPSAVSAKGVKKAAAKVKAKVKAKAEAPVFKRTSANPLSAANDPAHSPGHRKMNWKKYQETSKMSRKTSVRP